MSPRGLNAYRHGPGARLGILALLVLLLASCSGGTPAPAPAASPVAAPAAPAASPPAAPAASPAAASAASPAAAPAAASPAAAAAPANLKRGGTLNIGLDVDPGTMDPRLMTDTSAWKINDFVYNGLVEIAPDVKPVPGLATSWEISPDGLTYTFKLATGVKFHDGQPFTSADVKYTYDTVLDPALTAPLRSLFTAIKSIDTPAPDTVVFTLSAPNAPMLSYMDLGIVPKHIVEADPKALVEKPVGTGPFKFVSWEKRNKIELEANRDYFRGAPYVDRVVIRSIPDNNVRVVGLESGDLDLIHSPVPPDEWLRLEKDSRIKVYKTNALGYTFLTPNIEDPIFSDKRVRQAIAYLSDRKKIASSIFLDMDTPGLSPLIPGTWAYDETNIPRYDYNPERAKALLAEAGWTPGPGGSLQKDGKPLSFTLSTNVDPNRSQILEFLQNQYAQAGIQAEVKVYEWPSFFADVQAGKFQLALLGSLNLVDPDRAMYLHFRTGGPSNFARYSNPRVDELLDRGRTQQKLEDRKATYAEVARILAEDAPRIFLLYQGYVVMHRAYVEGYVPNPTGSMKSVEKVWLNK